MKFHLAKRNFSSKKHFEEIFDATGGRNWTSKTGWMSRASLSEWRGVKVDKSGQVIDLVLNANNLQGKQAFMTFSLNTRICYVDHH